MSLWIKRILPVTSILQLRDHPPLHLGPFVTFCLVERFLFTFTILLSVDKEVQGSNSYGTSVIHFKYRVKVINYTPKV